MYQVVIFTTTNEVELVPQSWMSGTDSCHWPSIKSYTTIGKWVKILKPKDNTWPIFPVRTLGKPEGMNDFFEISLLALFNSDSLPIWYDTASYKLARQKLVLATEKSDVSEFEDDSSIRLRQNRKRNQRYESDSEDNEGPPTAKKAFNLPPAPVLPQQSPASSASLFTMDEVEDANVEHHQFDLFFGNYGNQNANVEDDMYRVEPQATFITPSRKNTSSLPLASATPARSPMSQGARSTFSESSAADSQSIQVGPRSNSSLGYLEFNGSKQSKCSCSCQGIQV